MGLLTKLVPHLLILAPDFSEFLVLFLDLTA